MFMEDYCPVPQSNVGSSRQAWTRSTVWKITCTLAQVSVISPEKFEGIDDLITMRIELCPPNKHIGSNLFYH